MAKCQGNMLLNSEWPTYKNIEFFPADISSLIKKVRLQL